MKQIYTKKIPLIVFMFGSYTFYIWLRVQHSLRIHAPRAAFGDTIDYLALATEPIFSRSFWVASRPPVLPLFFKLVGSDPEQIFKVQLWISIIAWGILALAVAYVIRSYVLKTVGFALILAFSLGQNIIMWDSIILSDSLSISLVALFLATCLWLAVEWKPYKFLCLASIAILLVFIRDTFAYLLLMAGITLLLLVIVSSHRRRMLVVSGLFIILFLINNAQATAGERWVMPFYMTMGLRILPNPSYLAYFEAHGMPVNDALLNRSGKPGHANDMAFFKDPRLEEFRRWTRDHGRSQYIKFLWFYKADTLQSPLKDIQAVFNPDVYYYTATGYHPIITNTRLSELLYPVRFGILSVLFANFLAAVFIFPAFRYRQLLWSVPIMLILFSFPQAILIWNADANDIARHSLYHNIEVRLGLFLMIVFVADFIVAEVAPIVRRMIMGPIIETV